MQPPRAARRPIAPFAGAVHAALRALPRGATLAATLALAGCGGSLVGEGLGNLDVTGSITPRPATRLPIEAPGEDGRLAAAALGDALDPRREAGAVAWSAAESGARGSFAPEGDPYLQGEELCRAFTATLGGSGAGGVPAKLSGAACRQGAGPWAVRRLGPT